MSKQESKQSIGRGSILVAEEEASAPVITFDESVGHVDSGEQVLVTLKSAMDAR